MEEEGGREPEAKEEGVPGREEKGAAETTEKEVEGRLLTW